MLNSMRQTGSVLGVAIFGSLAGRNGAVTSGVVTTLAISAVLFALAASVVLFVSEPSASKPSAKP